MTTQERAKLRQIALEEIQQGIDQINRFGPVFFAGASLSEIEQFLALSRALAAFVADSAEQAGIRRD